MGRIRTFLQRHRARVAAQGLGKTLAYYAFTAGAERLGAEITRVYRFAGRPEQNDGDPPTELVADFDALTPEDLHALDAYGGERLVREFRVGLARGGRCALTRAAGRDLACVCWSFRAAESYAPARGQRAHVIMSCFTLPAFRGQGLYPVTLGRLASAVSAAHAGEPIYIESSAFNDASIRGIEKAGFAQVGTLFTLLGREHFRPA